MNPALGLCELNKNQLGANGTYFMVDLTFRMRSIAALASTFWEYMRYAAATVALRPGLHNESRPRIVADTHLFRPGSGRECPYPYQAQLE